MTKFLNFTEKHSNKKHVTWFSFFFFFFFFDACDVRRPCRDQAPASLKPLKPSRDLFQTVILSFKV